MSNFFETIQNYLDGITVLRQAVPGMNREQLIAKPIPGKWSTLECVAHIADFEPIFAERMKRVIAYDRPILLAADEKLFEASLDYQNRDLEEELAVVESTRRQMARILRGLNPEVAHRVGVHSYKGLVTLDSLLIGAANHLTHHVAFIPAKREAMGL